MINIPCPNCQRSLRMEEKFIGKKVKCIYCHQPFQVDVEQEPVSPTQIVPGEFDATASMTPSLDKPGFQPASVAGPSPAFTETQVQSGQSTAVIPSQHFNRSEQPRTASEPPPLPPRRRTVGAGLRVGPLVASIMSLTVIIGAMIGIMLVRRSASPETPQTVAPNRGERWAAIAIESGGVRLIIVDRERGENAQLDPIHGESREWSAQDLPNSQEEDKLNKILADMNNLLDQHKVPEKNRLVAYTDKFRDALPKPTDKNEKTIQAAVKKNLKREPEVLSADREAEYGARAIIPHQQRTKAIYLDLGGGSAKYGYFHSEKDFRGGSSDLGVRRAEKEIGAIAKTRKIPFAVAARLWETEGGVVPVDAIKDAKASPGQRELTLKGSDVEVRELIGKMPQLRDGEHYHLLGGTSWAISVLTHPDSFLPELNDRQPNVALTAADIAEVRAMLEQYKTSDELKAAALLKVTKSGDQQYLEEELRRVVKDFPHERLLAGVTVLKGFADECQMRSGKKEVQFFVFSLYAWPIGYISVKAEPEKSEKTEKSEK